MLIYLKKHYGTMILTILSAIPVFIWVNHTGVLLKIDSPASISFFLGKAFALSGLTLYCLTPVLSMRHRVIELAFGGLNKVYALHKNSGKVSFLLIMAHPIMLGAGGIMLGRSVGGIFNWTSALILTGSIALIGLIFITGVSIYAHIKHQKWVAIHRFFGWLLPLFILHGILAGGQIMQIKALAAYMLVVASLGFGAFVYRSVAGHYLIKRFRYEVAEVIHQMGDVTELVLKPKGVPINYTPGQFAFLSVDSGVVDNESHPYSFTTANNGPYIRFAIKALGDDTTKLRDLTPGTPAYIEGPYGNFSYYNANNKNQVWIAGGVGITPFLSMARSLSKRTNLNIKLFYATNELDDAAFLEELMSIKRELPSGFNVTVVSNKISGFINTEMIEKEVKNLKDFDYLICGPPPMMKAISQQLLEKGVEPDQIHSEDFSM